MSIFFLISSIIDICFIFQTNNNLMKVILHIFAIELIYQSFYFNTYSSKLTNMFIKANINQNKLQEISQNCFNNNQLIFGKNINHYFIKLQLLNMRQKACKLNFQALNSLFKKMFTIQKQLMKNMIQKFKISLILQHYTNKFALYLQKYDLTTSTKVLLDVQFVYYVQKFKYQSEFYSSLQNNTILYITRHLSHDFSKTNKYLVVTCLRFLFYTF
eukprot:TRINITY_DN3136_c1_g1_i2.p1 TRINITY_DN3136_c1_g1~~TRINITY_DN3136_c1_g1_i2.p1  ORF type:complete len:215 (-),score=-19.21 TRINITY_DN3136_c1_g1_i2:269-913(-)